MRNLLPGDVCAQVPCGEARVLAARVLWGELQWIAKLTLPSSRAQACNTLTAAANHLTSHLLSDNTHLSPLIAAQNPPPWSPVFIMSAPPTTRVLRQCLRRTSKAVVQPTPHRQMHRQALRQTIRPVTLSQPRWLSITSTARAGIMPETEDPKPPNDEAVEPGNLHAAQLTDEEYQRLSDLQMDAVHEKAEAMQESREDVEVEYSVGSDHTASYIDLHI